jgi:Flp pilus assembly protein TadG
MKPTHQATGRCHERGSIAVEAAIVLPVLLLFLGLPSVFLAFYFRQYSAAQKAVHDAALYLSTAPRIEMITAGPDGNPAALTLASTIAAREMAGLVPSGTSLNLGVSCLYQVGPNQVMKPCTTSNNQGPNNILIQLEVSINVPYVNPLTGNEAGLWTDPYSLVSYVGN